MFIVGFTSVPRFGRVATVQWMALRGHPKSAASVVARCYLKWVFGVNDSTFES